jgi:hypothetical protein
MGWTGLPPLPPAQPLKRKVFISFFQNDRTEVDAFILNWATNAQVFAPKALGIVGNETFINSSDPEYVMGQIRQKYLGDSTVTIILLGTCTHSRRYVDWEIKTSLRRGDYTPNGLIAILLSSACGSAHLPDRFRANWNAQNIGCYARYYAMPTSAVQLRGWIEDAFSARTTRADFIQNDADMMRYNARCRVCGITH